MSLGDLEVPADLEEIERRSPLARTLITVVVTVVLVGAVLAVLVAVSVAMRETQTATNRVAVDDLPQISLRATTADVTIVDGTEDELVVEAEVTSGLLGTDYELRRRGAELEVVDSCFALVDRGCGVAVTVFVPQDLPIEVVTESGTVRADGLARSVLTVLTVSGDIVVNDLRVTELAATSDAGRVEASFAAEPAAVKATTRTGDIDVSLGQGGQEYRVDLRSDGEVVQEVDSAPDAASFVRLHSDDGTLGLRR